MGGKIKVKLLKNKAAWSKWRREMGLASQYYNTINTTAKPLEFPCFAYCTVFSFADYELEANYVYKSDLDRMTALISKAGVHDTRVG